MSGERQVIDTEYRPPVVTYGGRSPIKGSKTGLNSNNSRSRSPHNQRNSVDYRPPCEGNWNERHHVSPSQFNGTNHTYYKQYFDKSHRMKEIIAQRPVKMLDPYEMNTVKGTRMPDWSKVSKERDVYGELGWVPNFQVKLSKNNARMHKTFKEFFDQPRNYHATNNSTATSDFFRKNAPDNSVAKVRNHSQTHFFKSFNNTAMRTSNGFNQTTQQPFTTPFYMVDDKTNKYRIDERLKQTVEMKSMIPFLRVNDDEYNHIDTLKRKHVTLERVLDQFSEQQSNEFHQKERDGMESICEADIPQQQPYNQLQYQKSPILQNQQSKNKDRYVEYSPLQNVNLNKYNFDYGQSSNPSQMMPDQGKDILQQPYQKFSGTNVNRFMNDQAQQQQMIPQLGARMRDAQSNDQLRMNRDLNFGGTNNDLNRFQQQFQQQPSMPPQPQLQPQNPLLQNSQMFSLMQNQQQQTQQINDPLQNNPQYVQLMIQQQQQMQLIQSLINQSNQIQQPALLQQQRQMQQQFEINKLLKAQQIQQPIVQQQPQSTQQQLLYQQLLQLQQQSQQSQQPQQQQQQQIFNSQQFKQSSINPSEMNSQLTTPLETARLMNSQQMPPTQNLQPQVPQQHQYFVQSYSQLQDNLNQYKKLVNYLEEIQDKKQTQPQATFQQNSQQMNQDLQRMNDKYDQNRNEVVLNFQQENNQQQVTFDKQKPQQVQSVLWPSQFTSSEIGTDKSFVSPQSSNQTNTFKHNDEFQNLDAQFAEQNFNKAYQQNALLLSNQKSQQESQLLGESKFIDGDYDRENIEDSKSSAGDLTKESFTENFQMNQNQFNIVSQQSDVNKSRATYLGDPDDAGSINNKSHISDQNKSQQNSDRKFQNSQDQNSFANEEIIQLKIEEKPILNNQLTFEELLESKLQEQSQFNTNTSSKPKKEFLRKSSHSRVQTSLERNKSQNKYKYYADNFANQQQQNAVVQPSPRSANTSSIFKKQNNETPNKVSKQLNKSNQKQPKQQKAPNRPHSQQQSSNQSQKQSNRSRQNQMSSVNTSKIISSPQELLRPEEDFDPLLSDRNSVAEFEMLEKECIAKSHKLQAAPQQQQQKPQEILQQEQQVKQPVNNSSNNKHQPKLSKQAVEQQNQAQKQLDQKIRELELEISKFKRENKKVQSLQKECEQQLKRVTKEIEDFESKKETDLMELQDWKKQQIEEIENEREFLAKEKAEIRKLREQLEKEQQLQQVNESDRFIQKIKMLEEDKKKLHLQIDELTNKEYHCQSVQTNKTITKESHTLTSIIGEVQPLREVHSQGVSPVKFSPDKDLNSIANQSIQEEEKEDSDTASLKNDNVSEQFSIQDQELQVAQQIQSHFIQQQEQQYLHTQEEKQHDIKAQTADEILQEEQDSLENEEDSDEDEFDLRFPQEYHGKHAKIPKLVDEIIGHDGKIQRFYDNGKKEVIFTNGVKREIWPDGYSVVYFNNNDIKQTFPDQKIVYYFYDAKTTQTTFANGLQVFKFSNNQIEKHFADGTKEISFPDGTIKCIFPDGEEESIFPDGTIQKIEKSGVRIIEFPSGQRDILYPDGTKVREFEDGSIKKIYPDGRIEMMQSKSQQQVQQIKKDFNVTLNKHLQKKK